MPPIEPDYPSLIIDGELYDEILAHAAAACIGGRSAVRASDDRQRALEEDQIVGQLGEWALPAWFGDPGYYSKRRALINKNPYVGDGGIDYRTPSGLNIDVKTSLIRSSMPLMNHRLFVRDAERHAENIFVLALVNQPTPPATVWFMGWAYDWEFKWKCGDFSADGDSPWEIPAQQLRPMRMLASKVA